MSIKTESMMLPITDQERGDTSFSRRKTKILPQLNKNYCLRTRNIESFPATHIFTDQNIVDPHHIILRFGKTGSIVLGEMPGNLFLFSPLHPANIIIIALSAEGAGIVLLFYFLPFIENIPFVHKISKCLFFRDFP